MERRVHARYTIGFGAEVHTERGVVHAGTRDVSRGGCQLRSGRPLREGATVRIDLCLTVDGIQEAEFPRLTVQGRIQWTAEAEDEDGTAYASGVRFENMAPAQGEWLEQILVRHGTPEKPPARPKADTVEVDIDIDM